MYIVGVSTISQCYYFLVNVKDKRQVTVEENRIAGGGEMRVLREALNLRDGTRNNGIFRM